MYRPVYTKQFEKDVKTAKKRKKNLEKLKIVVRTILKGEKLNPIHRDHKLEGSYTGRRECHLESDWLLIYKIVDTTVIFERTGTHSDLFR